MTPDSSPEPLGRITRVRAVAAHPDDESSGLGAVLSELVARDIPTSLPATDPPTDPGGPPAMTHGITVRLSAPFAPTVERVRAALADQGFGVLTEIDVQATLREKLGVPMEDYLILGACNPSLAHRALDADRDIGLLLPCNVVVRADGPGTTLVQALDPQVMVQMTGKPELKDVADQATARLRAALDTLVG